MEHKELSLSGVEIAVTCDCNKEKGGVREVYLWFCLKEKGLLFLNQHLY